MGGRFATPTGHFYVKKKEINPTWYPPDWADTTEPVHPGPSNPLGNRRLLLNITSYGIHGTNKPSSIGKAVTHGCIRMYPSDILELFEVISVGTKVDIIRYTSRSKTLRSKTFFCGGLSYFFLLDSYFLFLLILTRFCMIVM
jgi:hypothetical protein